MKDEWRETDENESNRTHLQDSRVTLIRRFVVRASPTLLISINPKMLPELVLRRKAKIQVGSGSGISRQNRLWSVRVESGKCE